MKKGGDLSRSPPFFICLALLAEAPIAKLEFGDTKASPKKKGRRSLNTPPFWKWYWIAILFQFEIVANRAALLVHFARFEFPLLGILNCKLFKARTIDS